MYTLPHFVISAYRRCQHIVWSQRHDALQHIRTLRVAQRPVADSVKFSAGHVATKRNHNHQTARRVRNKRKTCIAPAWLSLLCLCFPVPSCMVTAVPVRCVTPRGKTFQTRDAVREASSIISPGPRQEPKRPGLGPREHKSGHYGNVGRSQRNAMSAAVDCVAGGQPPPETGLGSRERPTKTAPLMATRQQAERDQVFIGRNRWEQLQGELTPGPRQQAKHVMNQNSGLQEAAPVDPVVLCLCVPVCFCVFPVCLCVPLCPHTSPCVHVLRRCSFSFFLFLFLSSFLSLSLSPPQNKPSLSLSRTHTRTHRRQ